MFTGIIEGIGKIKEKKVFKDGLELQITADFHLNSTNVGESIAVNGCCLTITSRLGNSFWAVVSHETMEKTTLKDIQAGDPVNLERPLQKGGRAGGHIVQGHVDRMAKCKSIKELNGSWLMVFENRGLVTVEKGSVCVNGVSLTVVESKSRSFSVAIIPHTCTHTNLHALKPGDMVNVEFDIIGKYVAKLLA